MVVHELEGKNEEILNQFLEEQNLKMEDIFYNVDTKNGGIFKGKKVQIRVVTKDDIKNHIISFFDNLSSLMNLDIDTKVEIENDVYKVTINCDNNSILIGKDGRTLKALQLLLKQSIVVKCDFNIKLNLDVSNYKEKKLKSLEILTRKLANEVIKTKVDVKMDSMNSYERRFVHNIIGEYTMLTTKSEGEEPNRYVVIKYEGE